MAAFRVSESPMREEGGGGSAARGLHFDQPTTCSQLLLIENNNWNVKVGGEHFAARLGATSPLVRQLMESVCKVDEDADCLRRAGPLEGPPPEGARQTSFIELACQTLAN